MHEWNISTKEAVKLQRSLSEKVLTGGRPVLLNYIAGIDLAYDKKSNRGFCAIIIFRYPELEIVEEEYTSGEISFPYVPGLLSFREGPLFIKTYETVRIKPDLLVFDGQGIAHPRGLGIASHMGVLLDIPSLGCAKSRLYGDYREPGPEKGAMSDLFDDNGTVIGKVLRTRDRVKPVFISPGHKIGIDEAVEIIAACVHKYRIPVPTGVADRKVEEYKRKCLKELID